MNMLQINSRVAGAVALVFVVMGNPLFAEEVQMSFKAEPLTLDRVADSIGDTVYVVLDFPEEEHRDVVKSLRSHWLKEKEQRGIQEVVFLSSDAPSFGSAKERLKGKNFYIYGTFALREHNLVFRSLADTPYNVTGKEAAMDIRGIIVGKNPFGGGFVNIFAAPSPRSLLDIHRFYEGTNSFIVVMEGRIVNRGGFDDDFRPIADDFRPIAMSLSESESLEDVDFFFHTLESVHPQLLAFVSPEDYLNLKRKVKEQLQAATDGEGKLSQSSLAVTLAEAAAFFQDGHTSLSLSSLSLSSLLADETDSSRRMLPFHLNYRFGYILIGNTIEELEHLKRHKLLKMNGVDFIEFIHPILDKISGERRAHKIAGFIGQQRTYWALIPLTDSSEISITVQDDQGQIHTQNIELIAIQDYHSKIPSEERTSAKSFYELYDGGKTCYYQYNSFLYSDSEKQYVDALFKVIKEKNVQNLIMDLRFNEGGNSSMGDYIISYLTSRPYRMFSREDVKLSNEIFEMGRCDRKFEQLAAGLTITLRYPFAEPEDRGYRFKGSVFVLTGPNTFSSAADFAAVVKDFEIGTIIGEETGGLRQCFGEILLFSLPHSKIEFSVSCKCFYAPIPKPDDDKHGTIPDVIVDEGMLSKYSDANNPVLAFALDYVRDH